MFKSLLPETVVLTTVGALILALPAQALSVSAQPDDYGPFVERVMPEPFDALDADGNGLIDFDEYADHATEAGLTRTAAAQRFTALCGEDATISQADYLYGEIVEEGPFWDTGYALEGEFFGEILDITPNEEVAGEVITAFEHYADADPLEDGR